MQYRLLGTTGAKVSQLAMGTMAFGGDADQRASAAMFHAARDAGINLFDCADVYQGGRSEEILGELIAQCRDEVMVATKAYFPTSDSPNGRGSNRFHLVRAVEASLRRLQTDRIDIFYLHRFDDDADLQGVLRTLDDLVAAGKILWPAVSNFAAWQVEKALGIAACRGFDPIRCVQPMYNLVKRQAEVEILPQAMASGLAVVPYSPLGGGLLSGKYGVDKHPASGRLVDNAMYQTRYGGRGPRQTADQLCALAADLSVHPVSLAIAWVAAHPGVTAPLIGARNVEQLRPALAAVDVDMTPALRATISALSPTPPPATDRNEEQSAHNYSAVLRK